MSSVCTSKLAIGSVGLLLSLLAGCQPGTPIQATQAPSSAPSTSPLASPLNLKPPVSGKTFFGIYMVGSDLEDDAKPRNGISDEVDNKGISTRGAGSSDLRELLEGWKQLTPAHKASLTVLVAFGGARKQGWQGVKYATLDCLAEDAQDNYFGNASCYSHSDASQNLSQSSSLSQFLKTAKAQSQGHDRVIIDLWDHGAAFLGMGHDTNHDDTDLIALPAIQKAFAENRFEIDLLGFDACLMASLEVARALQPYADYLLASQELEPGHGWQYTDWIGTLASETDIAEIGKKMVDSFITHPLHQRTRNKTLSLIDLRQIPALLAPLDRFIGQLPANTAVPVLPSLQATPEFGVQSRGDVAYTIDLREFINNITRYEAAFKADGQALLDQLAQVVVYSREDGSKPQAGGITIFSLNKDLKPEYNADQSVSRTFLNFVEQWLANQSSVTTAPNIQSESLQIAQVNSGGEVPVPECQDAMGRIGQCLTVQAEQGAKVERVLALQSSQGLEVLGRERLLPLDLEAERYFAERWDGYWFQVCDGNCLTGTPLTPSAVLTQVMGNGHRLYIAEAELNGQPIDFYLELDPQNGQVVSTWVVPHASTERAVQIPSRLDIEVGPGDQLAFVSSFLAPDGSLRKQVGPALNFSQTPLWRYVALPPERGQPVYLTRASANQNSSYTAPTQAAPPNVPPQQPASSNAARAASMTLAPSNGSVTNVGAQIKPTVYLKDASGRPLSLPLLFRSLSPGFEVSADGTVTYLDASVGFGSIVVTEPLSGLSQQWDIRVNRGSSGRSGGRSLGPTTPSPAWNLLNAPLGGRLSALSSDPSGTTLYAAAGRAVYRSSNGGGSWTLVNSTVSSDSRASINSILVDPNDNNTLYAAADTGFQPASDAGVFRSSDGGSSWTRVDSGLPNPGGQNKVLRLLLDGTTTPSMLYAGLDGNGVYASSDGGNSWSALNNAPLTPLSVKGMALVPGTSNPQSLLVGTQFGGGVYLSSNPNASPASVSWSNVSGDLNTCNPGAVVTELLPLSSSEWIAGVSGGGRICHTTNGGGNWVQRDTGLPAGIIQPNALAFDPNNPAVWYTAFHSALQIPEGVYQSTNSGLNWSAVNAGLPILDVLSLTRDSNNPARFWAGLNGAGLFSSTNPATGWSQQSLAASDVRAVAVDPSDANRVYSATFGGGVYASLDAGSSWSARNNGLDDLFVLSLAIDPVTPSTLYAMTRDNGLFQSTDAGANWVSVLNSVGTSTRAPLAIAPSNPQVIYVATALGLYKSSDGGASFAVLPELAFDNITALAVDPSDANTVYAGVPTTAPPGPSVGGLIKSTDGGLTWSDPPLQNARNYTQIVVDPSDSQRLYATTASNGLETATGLYVSTDAGLSWSASNTGLPELELHSLAVDPQRPQYVYVGTAQNGIYLSDNRGASWSAFNTNVSVNAGSIQVLSADANISQRIYAGTAQRGVLKNR